MSKETISVKRINAENAFNVVEKNGSKIYQFSIISKTPVLTGGVVNTKTKRVLFAPNEGFVNDFLQGFIQKVDKLQMIEVKDENGNAKMREDGTPMLTSQLLPIAELEKALGAKPGSYTIEQQEALSLSEDEVPFGFREEDLVCYPTSHPEAGEAVMRDAFFYFRKTDFKEVNLAEDFIIPAGLHPRKYNEIYEANLIEEVTETPVEENSTPI